MKKAIFTGAGVAIVTPMYEDGTVNFDELEKLVKDQIKHGTDAIIICGTTGEASTLTDEEHLACIGAAVKAANHKVPVIAGTGSNDTDHGRDEKGMGGIPRPGTGAEPAERPEAVLALL